MPLFDAYLVVDWSAAAVPRRGKDSIWYAEYRREGGRLVRRALANPATRAAATAEIAERLAALVADGRRVLAGFDFPFGYPRGTAQMLGLAGISWAAVWRLIGESLDDADDNANNRFDMAETLNRRMSRETFPFWGHPQGQKRQWLSARRPRDHRPGEPPERRLCERRLRRAQPVWKLAYTGSVGSQALTGIPRVHAIRHDPRLADSTRIWPLETGLADDRDAAVLLAEVYPSLFAPDSHAGLPKDAGQVTATARNLGEMDERGDVTDLLRGDPGLGDAEREDVESEEAWVLGVTRGDAP